MYYRTNFAENDQMWQMQPHSDDIVTQPDQAKTIPDLLNELGPLVLQNIKSQQMYDPDGVNRKFKDITDVHEFINTQNATITNDANNDRNNSEQNQDQQVENELKS